MENRDMIVSMRCFESCHYEFVFPRFFTVSGKATLRKVFKWLFQFDYYPENREAVEFFDREFPQLIDRLETEIEATKKSWHERSVEQLRDKADTDPANLPQEWTKKRKREEISVRKKANAELARKVKDAKAYYDRAVKDHAYAKEVYELFKEAKETFG